MIRVLAGALIILFGVIVASGWSTVGDVIVGIGAIVVGFIVWMS